MTSSSSSSSSNSPETLDYDIIIIGAGIAGINTSYRIQSSLPGVKYAILEARDNIGGTWDLFRYPGVRSDASMYAYGFEWHPWTSENPIGTGEQIRKYLADAVLRYGIGKNIRFGHRVVTADWSTTDGMRWTMSVDVDGDGMGKEKKGEKVKENKTFTARWIVFGTGYYDYENPRDVQIPGLEKFRGEVIHPQFWPSDFSSENRDRKIAIIGSGATATSLLPALAQYNSAQVTQIQRSPTYIAPFPSDTTLSLPFLPSPIVNYCRRIYQILRLYFVVLICTYFPSRVKNDIRRAGKRLLHPTQISFDEHFTPSYKPWDQRICVDWDGKFYGAFRKDNVDIATGHINHVSEGAIHFKRKQNQKQQQDDDDNNNDGRDSLEGEQERIIEVDVIITATGLRMMLGGKIIIRVDGELYTWGKRSIWNGAMLRDIPNMMFLYGYTNNVWTLGVDITARKLIRVWKYMEKRGLRMATPRISNNTMGGGSETDGDGPWRKMWPLSSTYVREVEDKLPRHRATGKNWTPRDCPPVDYLHARWGNCTTGLEFSEGKTPVLRPSSRM